MVQDQIQKSVQKPLTDATSISDTAIVDTGKALEDSTNTVEGFSVVVTKVLSDATEVEEFFGRGIFDETFDATFN